MSSPSDLVAHNQSSYSHSITNILLFIILLNSIILSHIKMQLLQVVFYLSLFFAGSNALALPVEEASLDERGSTPTFRYQE